MVLADLLASLIEWAGSMVGAHGFKTGVIASSLVVLYHGHSILAFVQTAARTAKIGFAGAALVGLLLVVGISMGWLSVGSLPSLPMPFLVEVSL